MVKNLITFILIVISTYPISASGDERYTYLENIVRKAENEFKEKGYDTLKLKKNAKETPISIFRPDCKMIYPHSADLYDQKDFDGAYYIRQIVKKAMDRNGKFSQNKYRWKFNNDLTIKTKLVVAKYLKKQNLIIAASEYSELLDPINEFDIKAYHLLQRYFAEVNRNGVDHENALEAYKTFKEYIEILPDRIKKIKCQKDN